MTNSTIRAGFAPRLALAAGALTALIAGGTASAAYAVETSTTVPASISDSAITAKNIDLGNGMTADVNTTNGSVLIKSVAGVVWDSTIQNINRYGLGGGRTWGGSFVSVEGGVYAYIPGMGMYTSDPAYPSGLRDYPGDDVRFVQTWNELPPRADLPPRVYAFTLKHVHTGVTDYFSPAGDLIASIDASGNREDRVYSWNIPHRLDSIIHPDGQETTINWENPDLTTVVSPLGEVTKLTLKWGYVVGIESSNGTSKIHFDTNGAPAQIESQTNRDYTFTRFGWKADGSVSEIIRNGERVYPIS